MFSLLNHPAMRAVALCLVVLILFAPAYYQAQAGANPIFTIFVTVMFGAIGFVIYDLLSCDLNVLFGGCGGGGGGGGGNNNGGGGAGNGNGSGAGNGSGSGSGGGGIPAACSTLPVTNACGMPGTGFVVGGVCNASVPPNSSCPVPVIGEAEFYADPARVRAGNTTTLHWDVGDATMCTLTGGGLLESLLGIVGSISTEKINAATSFRLTCQNGTDGPEASAEVVVTIVPSFEEI